MGGAKYYQQRNENNSAAYSLHQAMEHTLRALLISITEHSPTHHDLFRLLRYTLRLTEDLNEIFPCDSEYESGLLVMLNKSYRHARYNNSFIITDNDLNVLFERVSLLQSTTLLVFEKLIDQYRKLFEQPEPYLAMVK